MSNQDITTIAAEMFLTEMIRSRVTHSRKLNDAKLKEINGLIAWKTRESASRNKVPQDANILTGRLVLIAKNEGTINKV